MSHPLARSLRVLGLAAVLSAGLSACGGQPGNRTLNSVHQPVVERSSFLFDVVTLPGGGMSLAEQRRLAGWFDSLSLGYGDKVALDDPATSVTTREEVQAILSGHGLVLSESAPVTVGTLPAGTARLVITRTTASVPGCPDWSAHSDANFNNATSTNYGCAVNSNLAAMVADKEDLVRGQSNAGTTTVMTSNKAIDAFRAAQPTGKGGTVVRKSNTSDVSTGGGSGGGGGGGGGN